MSFPAQRRKPRDSTKAPRLDPPGRGPGRRAQPGRPSVKPTPMTPGTDDNRRRRFQRPENPDRPFGRKAPAPATGPKLGKFWNPFEVPFVPTWYDAPGWWYAVRNPNHPGNPTLPDPGYWALKHGLNKPELYYSPSYWDGRNRGYVSSTNAFGSAGTGPGTGLISGQSISVHPSGYPGVLTGTGTNFGWWIKNETLNRYAQQAAFIKRSTLQQPNFRQSLMEQVGPVNVWVPPPWFPPVGEPVEQGEPSAPPKVPPMATLVGAQAKAHSPGLELNVDGKRRRFNDPHSRKPPGKGRKEAKSLAAGPLEFFRNVLGGWSEFNDTVSAFHDALPEQYQAKSYFRGRPVKPSWKKQWNAVYQHFDKVKIPDAFRNLIRDQSLDIVQGKLSKFKHPAIDTQRQPRISRTALRGW